jgi:two-component system sensor histidine kinase DesK
MSTVLPDAVGPRRLSQGITATWWYTVSGVMVFQLTVVFIWLITFVAVGVASGLVMLSAVGGLVWCAASVWLLLQYRHRDDAAGPLAGWRHTVVPLVISVVFGAFCSIISGLWLVGALPIVQTLMLLNWPSGVRMRIVVAAAAVLAALWFIDWRESFLGEDAVLHRAWWTFGFFAVALPAMTVLSLWWWDVLATLDRARAAESRLGATQERLRIATDVHDLQGHHLQVIALQLELAERLLAKEPDAALEQLRLARASVAEARQGTRDLATRFRGVPLPDEIANAVDLLRAAGTTAEAAVSADAAQAPASVLGPVIRETTTNVLRHGGGRWARLSLRRHDGSWWYEIANDTESDAATDEHGSGLDGIARRVSEAGGEARVERAKGEFRVVVRIPDVGDAQEAQR